MLGKVLFNGVLIQAIGEKAVDKKSKGGIILPDNLDEETAKKIEVYREHPNKGIVIQVGPNVTTCKPGDCVYMTSFPGVPLIESGVYYLYIREHDIAYVIDKGVWDSYTLEREEKSNSAADVTT